MHRQEFVLHPNECNEGDLPGPLSVALSCHLERRSEKSTIGREAIFGAAVERKLKLRKGMDPK
jgi:hypothetical protein